MITCLGHWFRPIVLPAVCLCSCAEKATLNQSYCVNAGEEKRDTTREKHEHKESPDRKRPFTAMKRNRLLVGWYNEPYPPVLCVCVCMGVRVRVCVCVFPFGCFTSNGAFQSLHPFLADAFIFTSIQKPLSFSGQSIKCVMLTKGE